MRKPSHHWFWRNPPPVFILGCPWLMKHQHVLSWTTGDVLQLGSSFFPGCFPRLPQPSPEQPLVIPVNTTSIESPVAQQSVDFPACYADVFCLKWASKLPPRWPWDCAIDLESGKLVPCLSSLHSRTEGHGGVYWRGSKAHTPGRTSPPRFGGPPAAPRIPSVP